MHRELKRGLTFGFQPAELEHEIKLSRVWWERSLRTTDTVDTGIVALVILAAFEGRWVVQHPRDALEIWENDVRSITVSQLNAALREMFTDAEPSLAFLTAPQAVSGGDGEILKLYRNIAREPVTAPGPFVVRTFPYTDFGAPGAVTERRQIKDLDATLVKFANGVRLNVKATKFKTAEVVIVARFPGGYLDFPNDKAIWDAAYTSTWVEGGLTKLDTNDLQVALAAHITSQVAGMGDDSYYLFSSTQPDDCLLQLQILTAFLIDPAFRPEALMKVQDWFENGIKSQRATAHTVLDSKLGAILRSGDQRWAIPALSEVKAMTTAEVRAKLGVVFARRPIEITIVGDISVDSAIDSVARTFGALSARDKSYEPLDGARNVTFPRAAQTFAFDHDGRSDQAVVFLAWPGQDFYANPRKARTYVLLRDLLRIQLSEKLRELGKTYSPSLSQHLSNTFPGFGYLGVGVETNVIDADFVKTAIKEQVSRLVAGEISDDLLARARTPVIERIQRGFRDNGYWLGALSNIQTDPRVLQVQRTFLSDYKTITKREVVAVANEFLSGEPRIEVRVVPATTAMSRPAQVKQ